MGVFFHDHPNQRPIVLLEQLRQAETVKMTSVSIFGIGSAFVCHSDFEVYIRHVECRQAPIGFLLGIFTTNSHTKTKRHEQGYCFSKGRLSHTMYLSKKNYLRNYYCIKAHKLCCVHVYLSLNDQNMQ